MSTTNAPAESATSARSGELLRLAIARMGAHASGFDPRSYAVWYEYVEGGLPGLREEVDALIAGGKRLNGEQTESLYVRHIRHRAEETVDRARAALASLLAQMHGALHSASASGEEFAAVLDTFGTQLAETKSVATMREQVDTMRADTASMRNSIDHLSTELSTNQQEVERLKDELSRLREDVLTDPLTGLVNRRGFDTALAGLKIAVTQGNPVFSVVLADIDHFKAINDTHGHLIGDRVIQQVAAIIKSCTRGGDTAVRYGGEEFAVVLPGTSRAGARVVAENVRTGVQRAVIRGLTNTHIGSVTISLGIATYRAGEPVEHCTQRADMALYMSKQGGRNRITIEP